MDEVLRQLLRELRGAWRFRRIAMLTAWLVGLAGVVIAFTVPDRFEARAQVFVDTRDPLVTTPTNTNDADVSVAFVRRLLLSTPNLEQVARETALDQRAETSQAFELLVSSLQEQIIVEQAGKMGFESNLYEIAYRDPDRATAESVVNVLLQSFQEQSLEGDLRDDEQALSFLDVQIDDYRRRLEEAEARVADFRRRNAGLVGAEGGFFNRLDMLNDELRQVRADLRIARDTKASLTAQFVASGSGSGAGAAAGLAELENQTLQAERQLDELRLLYTEEHPSIISARETLEALQTRLAARRQELGPLISPGATGAVVENVSIALTEAEISVNQLSGRQRELEQQVQELQQKVEVAPQLEAELAGLNRDNDVLRGQYESLLERRELLSFDIDRKRQGRQLEFRIIEPPLASEFPVEPNRRLLMLLALFAALAAGGGLAFVLHQINPVFITGEALYQQLGVPVLGAVTMIWTASALAERQRSKRFYLLSLALLVSVFALIYAFLPAFTILKTRLLA